MNFPDKLDYITFPLSLAKPAKFSFPSRKPRKIFFDSAANDFAFRFKINDYASDILLHISRNEHIELTIPSEVNNISFTTTNETDVYISLFIEEWGN